MERIRQKYGALRQLAFVPRDFDAALRYWTDLVGVGPFFYFEHIPLIDVRYRGHPIELDCSAAISFWGDLEIELLRQHDARPSAFTEWLKARGEGVHHIRLDCDDLDAARRYCTEDLGGEIVQEACMPGGGCYFLAQLHGSGPLVEFAVLTERLREVFAHIRQAARSWDGREPLRTLSV